MARVLIIYHRGTLGAWRATYESHVTSFATYSDNECLYLNTARPHVPHYIRSFRPDLVVFHYTFLAVRQDPPAFRAMVQRIGFVRDLDCTKVLIPHDEQAHSDFLCEIVNDFGVTHIFTPASPPEWPQIYEGIDFARTKLHTVLTGYVDEASVRRIRTLARRHPRREIDVGYRAWDSYAFYGRHGQLKSEIGRVFAAAAPEFGLRTDISSSYRDALMGDRWFDFLLRCKYTIGVEGGSSVFDRDGSIAECSMQYVAEHGSPSFEEVEAACFPHKDGKFGYRLIGPRHLEAVMTRTCQVLVVGDYAGVLQPEAHYLALERDFSNLPQVLERMRDDSEREAMTERAYQDIVASGRYSYQAFADFVYAESFGRRLKRGEAALTAAQRRRMRMNRFDDRLWLWRASMDTSVRRVLRPMLSRVLGEDRLRRALSKIRRARR